MKTLERLEQYRLNKMNEMKQKADYEKQAYLREIQEKEQREL